MDFIRRVFRAAKKVADASRGLECEKVRPDLKSHQGNQLNVGQAILRFAWPYAHSMKARNRVFFRAIVLMFFAVGCNVIFSFQAMAGHAPIVFYNVPNWYSGGWDQIRYDTPYDAFAIEWNNHAFYCDNGTLAYRLTGVQMVHSSGYEDGDLYEASMDDYNTQGCTFYMHTTYSSGARRFANCGNPKSSAYSPDDFPGGRCPDLNPSPDKNRGYPRQSCICKADPVNPTTGNKFEFLTVFKGEGAFPLEFTIAYNSQSGNSGSQLENELVLGAHRVHSYLSTIRVESNAMLTSAYVLRPDGKVFGFDQSGTSWVGDADVSDTLAANYASDGSITGWIYTTQDGTQEHYSAAGRLISLVRRSGLTQTLSYNAGGQLESVTDPQNRSLKFTYDSNGRIQKMEVPDGKLYVFYYDASNNLNSITYPDKNELQFIYGENNGATNFANINDLTGVVDEIGNRTDTTLYNSYDQVSSDIGAGGVNTYTFNYAISNGSLTYTVTNPLGMVEKSTTQYLFGVPVPMTVIHQCAACSNLTRQYSYDADGYVASTTDFKGDVTTMVHDTNGLLDQQVDGAGSAVQRTTNITWNTTLRVPLSRTILDASGNAVASTSWVYNTTGQPLARCEIDPTVAAAASYTCAATDTVPAGVRRWTYTYCSAVNTTQCPIIGLPLTVTSPRTDLAQTTTYSYYMDSATAGCGTFGGTCHQAGDLHTITDALGHIITIESYDEDGRITRLTDANGANTDLTYTPRGWLATRSVGGAMTTIGYTPYGAVSSITDPDGVITTYTYDTAHRLTDITDAQGNDIHYTLDAAGNKTAEQTRNAAGTVVRSQSRSYNALGQLTAVIDGLNHTVFNAGDSDSYDGNGNLVHSTDALGIQRQQGFDALNRLNSTIANYNGTDPATRNTQTTFDYDALDRLDGVGDPSGLATVYTYDGLGNRTALQSPDTGTSTDTYDAAGNRLTHTDARGITSTSTYDALNRITSTAYPDATQNVGYVYDSNPDPYGNTTSRCSPSAAIGHLREVLEAGSDTQYCYDDRGNVVDKIDFIRGAPYQTDYVYDSADRLLALTTPDSTVITYSYDKAGRLAGVNVQPSGAGGASKVAVSAITWLPFGPIAGYTLGNGQQVRRDYDANYRLTDLTSPAFNLHLERDAMGNIVALGDTPGASPAQETYRYDALYRLQGVFNPTQALETYDYNRTGDRTAKTAPGVATGTYSYVPGTHQVASIGSALRTHDANGNTLTSTVGGNSYAFTYDDRNRMSEVESNGAGVAEYINNAMGQRVAKFIGTGGSVTEEHYVYDLKGHLLAEYGVTNRVYIWAGDLPVAVIDKTTDSSAGSSTVNYITADQLNTPRAVSNASGATIWNWAYQGNPFGEQQPTSTTGYVLNLRYPGQYYDAETNTNYNMFRTYEPATGRYLQSDPVGLLGGLSTFGYVGSNPLSYTDPWGLTKYKQVPANAVQYVSGSGVRFYAPPGANFGKVESAGQTYGSNPIATWINEGHEGNYDFQRNNGDFYSQYTNASNYGVGVYLFGAGYTADEAITLGEEFATFFSSNAGDGTQVYWWLQGWNDAADGALAKKMVCQ